MLVRLEVHEVVAAALKANVINDLLHVLVLNAGLALSVRDQALDVADEVGVSIGDAAGGEDHSALTVLPIFRVGVGIFKRY